MTEQATPTAASDLEPVPAEQPTPAEPWGLATRFKTPTSTLGDPHQVASGRHTPPERFDPDNSWHFSDLASACTVEGADAASRHDPWWDDLWGAGGGASWTSATTAARHMAAGVGELPTQLAMPEAEAIESFCSPSSKRAAWGSRLALAGSLFSWRTMSAQQAAALTGDAGLTSPLHPAVSAGFASHLLDLGVFVSGLNRASFLTGETLLRPSRSTVYDEEIAPRLTMPERVAVTGGLDWVHTAQWDQHNVLATELGLRAAEYAEVGTVLGERFCTVDLLAGSGLGRTPIVGDQRSADLCIVRPDGMRVAIEITRTISKTFTNKVRKWAQLLAERPMAISGLTVVFVVMTPTARAATYQAIAAACKEFPGAKADRVAARMGVASWREWFPSRHRICDAFFTLRADRPIGRGAELWQPADFLDSGSSNLAVPFTARDRAAMTAVISNAALLGQTPYWLRQRGQESGDVPAMWPLLLRDAGVTSVPVPTPARPNRTKGRALGEAVGAAGPTGVPVRLRGLA
ncbi:hypothetical protein [Nocardioides sp. InS609-2]|uniref:hypothetical protein n=1 Tax=Nocardioides sp. InS609-2 TaxID=2760705 RepID=UPI0020BF316C|nr:hypothetical protein [Nocardioides sp. InS609-2]